MKRQQQAHKSWFKWLILESLAVLVYEISRSVGRGLVALLSAGRGA